MKNMRIAKLYCIALFLVLAFGLSSSTRVPHVRKHYLKFINNLSNKVLNVNCKNLNPYVDLNLHILLPGEVYEFNYDITRTMNFSCDLRHGFTSTVFSIGDKATKRACGGNHCIWKSQDDGVYLLNRRTKQFKFIIISKWGEEVDFNVLIHFALIRHVIFGVGSTSPSQVSDPLLAESCNGITAWNIDSVAYKGVCVASTHHF
nr:hypothetical protein CFP56_72883 [Quercus suber]